MFVVPRALQEEVKSWKKSLTSYLFKQNVHQTLTVRAAPTAWLLVGHIAHGMLPACLHCPQEAYTQVVEEDDVFSSTRGAGRRGKRKSQTVTSTRPVGVIKHVKRVAAHFEIAARDVMTFQLHAQITVVLEVGACINRQIDIHSPPLRLVLPAPFSMYMCRRRLTTSGWTPVALGTRNPLSG